jgi:hypothetical protein
MFKEKKEATTYSGCEYKVGASQINGGWFQNFQMSFEFDRMN